MTLTASDTSRQTSYRRPLLTLAAATASALLIWWGTPDLPPAARWTLLIFAVAMIGWVATRIDDAAIALAAALALVAAGAVAPGAFYQSLGNELVWLMIATFMISEVLRQSTLAERAAGFALRHVRTVRGMFYALASVAFATAFVMPSPSARAALFLPVYLALTSMLDRATISKGLALLLPSVILLSASGVLTGSGAHLLALDLLGQASATNRPDYLQWLMLALPIALVSCVAATALILRIFVGAEAHAPLRIALPEQGPLTARQWFIAAVLLAAMALWITTPWHGVSIGIVAVAAALLLTQPQWSGVNLKTAARGVEWSLVLFFAATILLGQAMVSSGAGKWVADTLLASWSPQSGEAPVAVALVVSVVALLAHLLVVSRSARAAILVPTLALPVANLGYDPTALVLLTVIGTGYCQTLPVSAKTVTLFSRAHGTNAPHAADFMRLSLALFPIMLAAMLGSAFFVWPYLGLALTR